MPISVKRYVLNNDAVAVVDRCLRRGVGVADSHRAACAATSNTSPSRDARDVADIGRVASVVVEAADIDVGFG